MLVSVFELVVVLVAVVDEVVVFDNVVVLVRNALAVVDFDSLDDLEAVSVSNGV